MVIDYEKVFGQVLGEVTVEDVKEETQNTGKNVKELKNTLSPEDDAILKEYAKLMEENVDKKIQFTGISNIGTLYKYEGNVKIILPVSCMSAEHKKIVAQGRIARDQMLDGPYDVRVLSIEADDPERLAVITTTRPKSSQLRSAAVKALDHMISQKDLTRIKAKVVTVDMGRRRILLDIGGYGIKGVCNLSDWNALGASTDLNMLDIKEGDVASVSVISKYDSRPGFLSGAYRCVRAEANPYAGIERKFPVGSVVRAVAMICNRQGYAFLKIEGFDAVQLMCPFPWKRDAGHDNSGTTSIICGHTYKVVVTKSSEKDKKFRGRIIEECQGALDKEIAQRAEYRAEREKENYTAVAMAETGGEK